ncbi:sigma factor-like helix-turn-helix DNA-binding protein [Lysinibacillus sphaericus]|uniref:sigma factor-like helix-turn-helix DNA-binding protein n=1 Tax=Lysinibacillus sphaericus TaxID=1421 RepID=UPI003D006EBD
MLILYYYQELKVREIADMLGCSDNTVKTRLRRARQMLQGKLERGDWEVLVDDRF